MQNVTKSATISNNNSKNNNYNSKIKHFEDFFAEVNPNLFTAVKDEEFEDSYEDSNPISLDWKFFPGKNSSSIIPSEKESSSSARLNSELLEESDKQYTQRLAQHLERAFLSEIERDAEADLVFDNVPLVRKNNKSNDKQSGGSAEWRMKMTEQYLSGSGTKHLREKFKKKSKVIVSVPGDS